MAMLPLVLTIVLQSGVLNDGDNPAGRLVDGRGTAPGWDSGAVDNACMAATQDARYQCGAGSRPELVEAWRIGRDTNVIRYTYALGRFRCAGFGVNRDTTRR